MQKNEYQNIFVAGHPLIFVQSSPRQFNAKGREEDSDAIVAAMDDADEFVHISVMDYMPATVYRTSNNNVLVPNFHGLQFQRIASCSSYSGYSYTVTALFTQNFCFPLVFVVLNYSAPYFCNIIPVAKEDADS